jgi:hypothetical protein
LIDLEFVSVRGRIGRLREAWLFDETSALAWSWLGLLIDLEFVSVRGRIGRLRETGLFDESTGFSDHVTVIHEHGFGGGLLLVPIRERIGGTGQAGRDRKSVV